MHTCNSFINQSPLMYFLQPQQLMPATCQQASITAALNNNRFNCRTSGSAEHQPLNCWQLHLDVCILL